MRTPQHLFMTALVVLASTFPGPHQAHAQVPKVTAGQVVDRETLRGFVTWATSEFSMVTDINTGSQLVSDFRVEGSDWNAGNMYLILLTMDGQVLLHGEDPHIDGKNVLGVVDDRGTRVVEQMLAAGAAGGGFVEWCWDDPLDAADTPCKDSYALQYHSMVAGVDLVVVGGYFQNLAHAGEPLPDVPLPALSAADVVDRETLKQFVEGSVGWLTELVGQVGFERANEWKTVMREDGGHFRSGPVYLFVFTPQGYVIFHGADPWREGRTALDNTDFQGRPFVRDVIAVAQGGGGFVEYFWDDPTVEGDEDTGSPKVSYAVSITSDLPVFQDIEFIVGAGFYRNFSTAEAEAAAADWLQRFGRSVASQTMEMIGNRVSTPYRQEDFVEVGGRTLDFSALLDPNTLASAGVAGPSILLPMSAGGLFGGSSFQLSSGGSGGGYSLWGGGEIMRFTNEEGGGFGDGEVRTAVLGADYEVGPVVTGLAVTHSRGSGNFELGRPGQDDAGEVSSSLTSGFPYARLAISDRLLTWGVLGYGAGRLDVTGGGEEDPESNISMRMGGVGFKGDLVRSEDAGGFELALRSDAFLARMNSEAVEGRSELTADASRVRMLLEASTGLTTGSGAMLRPQVRAGMRYDGGDTESGLGMEAGGGFTFLDPNLGLTIRVHGRTLLTHEQSGYEEWGLGGSIDFNPGGDGRGLSVGLRPTWGSTASGLARLWAQGAAGMTASTYGARGLNAEVGYGFGAGEGEAVFMPYARLAMSEQPGSGYLGAYRTASPDANMPLHVSSQGRYGYQLGGRLTVGPGLSANIEAGRSAWAPDSGPAHSAMVNFSLHW